MQSMKYTLGTTSPLPVPTPASVFAAYASEAVTLSFDGTLAAPTITVVREPAGSELEFTSGSATPLVPGYYELRAQDGDLQPRSLRMVVYPAAALTANAVKSPNTRVTPSATVADPSPRSESTVRERLQRHALEEARAGRSLTAFDALTANAPLPTGITWR